MVIHTQEMSVPEEKSERTKLLDCLEDARRDAREQSKKHHGDTPNKNGVFHNEPSHSHTHEGEGDPLAGLDGGTHEICHR